MGRRLPIRNLLRREASTLQAMRAKSSEGHGGGAEERAGDPEG